MLKLKCFHHGSVSFIGSKFMQDTPMQLEQMLVQTTPYCLHVQFFCVQSVLQPHLTVFHNFGGATCLVILIDIILHLVNCQPHFKGSSTWSFLHACT